MKKVTIRGIAAFLSATIVAQSAFFSPVTAYAAEDGSASFASENESTEEIILDTEESDEIAVEPDEEFSEDFAEDISVEPAEDLSQDISEEASLESSDSDSESPEFTAATQIGDEVYYTVSGSVIKISGTGPTYDYKGYNDSPLSSLKGITQIIVEEGVTTLGNYLLSRINNDRRSKLTKVSLPGTLVSIGDGEFNSFDGENVDLVIPGSVTHIGARAFEGTMRSLTLSEGITTINKEALWNAKPGKLNLPDSLTTIEESAFGMLRYSGTLVIPKNVQTIGPKAFEKLDIMTRTGSFAGNMPKNFAEDAFSESLMVMTYPAGNSTWSDSAVKALSERVKNVTFIKEGTNHDNKCGEDITWKISGSTLTLTGSGPMFDYSDKNQVPWATSANKITALSLDKRITTIADYSFYGMKLSSVTLPSSLTRIGKGAFEKSTLKKANLPAGVTYFGDRAFYYCYDMVLTGTFNADMTYVGDGAFYLCDVMTPTIPKLNCIEYIGAEAFAFTRKMTVKSMVLPKTLTYIGNEAFMDSSKSSVEISLPTSLTYLGRYAFDRCTNFKGNLVLHEGIKEIGYGAFQQTGITSVTINTPVLDKYTFSNCTNLTKAVIGPGVKTLPMDTFYGCSKLATVEGMEDLEIINDRVFYGCKALKSLTFGEKLNALHYDIIGGAGITSLTFTGDKPKTIYADTFKNAPSGITVKYPRNRPRWYGITAEKLCMGALNPKLEPYGPELICTITYKLGKGPDAEIYKTETVKGGDVLVKPEDPVQEHKEFRRWIDESTGKEYRFSDMVTRDITLYAEWRVETYGVYFKLYVNGSYWAHRYRSCEYGAKVTPPDLRAEGYSEKDYKITAWSLTRDEETGELGELVDMSKFVVTGETVFYANIDSYPAPVDPTPVVPTPDDPDPDDPSDGPYTEWGDVTAEVRKAKGFNSPADIPVGTWLYTDGDVEYTGMTVMPSDIRVFDGNRLLSMDYYTVKATNAIKAGKATLKITFKNGYKGTLKEKYQILPMDINDETISVMPAFVTYNGKVQKKKPSIIRVRAADKTFITLKPGKDYKVSYDDPNGYRETGFYSVTVTGKGNYTGTATGIIAIQNAIDMSKVKISGVKNMPYTGDEVVFDSDKLVLKYGKYRLVEGQDFVVSYAYNIEVGTAYILLSGTYYMGGEGGPAEDAKYKFTGYKLVSYKIKGTPISKAKIEGATGKESYTGSEIRKTGLTLTYSAGKGAEKVTLKGIEASEYEKLPEYVRRDYDYTYKYENNVNVGTAKIIIRGVNGFTGTVTKTFKIKK
jgi:hypothetical protein